METNSEGTAQTYIFLVDNQDIALNIVMSGYQALCLVQEDELAGYYRQVEAACEGDTKTEKKSGAAIRENK